MWSSYSAHWDVGICSPCHEESITHFSGCLSVAGSFTINSDAIDVLMLGLVWWLRYSKAVCKLVDQLVSSLIKSMYMYIVVCLLNFVSCPSWRIICLATCAAESAATPLHKSPSVSARANGCPCPVPTESSSEMYADGGQI